VIKIAPCSAESEPNPSRVDEPCFSVRASDFSVASGNGAKHSLPGQENSLVPANKIRAVPTKIPAPLFREFVCKPLNFRIGLLRNSPERAPKRRNQLMSLLPGIQHLVCHGAEHQAIKDYCCNFDNTNPISGRWPSIGVTFIDIASD
jgi:hypothetical protein